MSRKSTLVFTLIVVCGILPLVAQQPLVALHHEGNVSFFSSDIEAYDAAVNGDTLYFPGGNFGGLPLNKSLTLIGVGHHPDSTLATGATKLSALDLYAGSGGSVITGIHFENQVKALESVSNIVISKCFLNDGFYFNVPGMSSWIISENWIGRNNYFYDHISFYSNPVNNSLVNFLVTNNVIEGRSERCVFFNSAINNNIIISAGVHLHGNVCTFKSNIFPGNVINYTTNSYWYYNLNAGVNGSSGTNIGSNNYLDNIPLESVFVNYSGGNTFYQNDFHVVNPAYIGDDGTPVGIYGGPYPWKEGSLPFNPHIRVMQVNSATNPDGTIHINAEVKAQQN